MSRIVNYIRNNYGKIITGAAGAVALYTVARDAHINAKIEADSYMKTKDAQAAEYFMANAMTCDKASTTKIRMQNKIFGLETKNTLRGFFNSGIGYFKGFLKSLIHDVVPLVLGTFALFAKRTPAKVATVLLGLYAGFSFFKDGLGIGRNKLKF